MVLLQLLLVTALLLVHLFAGKMRFLDGIPRSRWLSFGGGIAVTYVFLHIFPEIKEAQETISEERQIELFAGQYAYLVALVGLILFYGLERVVKSTQKSRGNDEPRKAGSEEGETTTGMGVFWLHIASFALYNALIGYLLVHREDQEVKGLLLFFVAIALHFLVNDYGLRQDHKDTYHQLGRWVLAGAVLGGWLIGLVTDVGEVAVDVLFSLVAGAIILNVLKEELPEERQSRFLPFITGVTFYAILLLLL
jgi:zinc transporter ZupT